MSIKTYNASEVNALQVHTKIFSDGGCVPNPGKAGSGVSVFRRGVVEELWHGMYEPTGTNNTAELQALLQAIIIAEREVVNGRTVAVFSDSKYSLQSIHEWAVNWEKRGWTKKGGPIKNLEVIKEIYYLYQPIKRDVKLIHVNGHVGIEGNELADLMTGVAIRECVKDFVKYDESVLTH